MFVCVNLCYDGRHSSNFPSVQARVRYKNKQITISVISWRFVLLVWETGVPREDYPLSLVPDKQIYSAYNRHIHGLSLFGLGTDTSINDVGVIKLIL
jgi:hypothetical protein